MAVTTTDTEGDNLRPLNKNEFSIFGKFKSQNDNQINVGGGVDFFNAERGKAKMEVVKHLISDNCRIDRNVKITGSNI